MYYIYDCCFLFLTTVVHESISLHEPLYVIFTDLHGFVLFQKNNLPKLTQDLPKTSWDQIKCECGHLNYEIELHPHGQEQPSASVNASRNASRSFTGLG